MFNVNRKSLKVYMKNNTGNVERRTNAAVSLLGMVSVCTMIA
jgi:hypothetical protein